IIGVKYDAPLSEGEDVILCRLDDPGGLGAFHLGPVQALMLEDDHWVRVVVCGLKQAFQIRPIARVGDLDAPDIGYHRFDRRGMIRSAGTVCSDGYTDNA